MSLLGVVKTENASIIFTCPLSYNRLSFWVDLSATGSSYSKETTAATATTALTGMMTATQQPQQQYKDEKRQQKEKKHDGN